MVLKGFPGPWLACERSANHHHLCFSAYASEDVWTGEFCYPWEALKEQARLLWQRNTEESFPSHLCWAQLAAHHQATGSQRSTVPTHQHWRHTILCVKTWKMASSRVWNTRFTFLALVRAKAFHLLASRSITSHQPHNWRNKHFNCSQPSSQSSLNIETH